MEKKKNPTEQKHIMNSKLATDRSRAIDYNIGGVEMSVQLDKTYKITNSNPGPW